MKNYTYSNFLKLLNYVDSQHQKRGKFTKFDHDLTDQYTYLLIFQTSSSTVHPVLFNVQSKLISFRISLTVGGGSYIINYDITTVRTSALPRDGTYYFNPSNCEQPVQHPHYILNLKITINYKTTVVGIFMSVDAHSTMYTDHCAPIQLQVEINLTNEHQNTLEDLPNRSIHPHLRQRNREK